MERRLKRRVAQKNNFLFKNKIMEDDDFNLDDFSNEENDDFEQKQKNKRSQPIYLKAVDIFRTVEALASSLSGDDKEMYVDTLRESAMMLAPKIAGVIGGDSWILSMQNAAIIRYHAEYLLTATSGLKAFTKADKDYVKVLRDDMEEFRELFKEWVKTFEKIEKEDWDEDEWGLFVRQ